MIYFIVITIQPVIHISVSNVLKKMILLPRCTNIINYLYYARMNYDIYLCIEMISYYLY